jgi:hypothetical protein
VFLVLLFWFSLGFTIWELSWRYSFADIRFCCCFIALTQPDVGDAPRPAHKVVVGQSVFPAYGLCRLFYANHRSDPRWAVEASHRSIEIRSYTCQSENSQAALTQKDLPLLVTHSPLVWSYRSRRC